MGTRHLQLLGAFVHVARPFPTMLKNSLLLQLLSSVPLGIGITQPLCIVWLCGHHEDFCVWVMHFMLCYAMCEYIPPSPSSVLQNKSSIINVNKWANTVAQICSISIGLTTRAFGGLGMRGLHNICDGNRYFQKEKKRSQSRHRLDTKRWSMDTNVYNNKSMAITSVQQTIQICLLFGMTVTHL